MSNDVLGRLGDLFKKREWREREWYEIPRLFAMGRLVEIRNELREKNLHDTEEPAMKREETAGNLDAALREGRSTDGSYNDLHYPKMGCVGRRFGRNVPLDKAFPDTKNLLNPNPRVVSRELMTRHKFEPATIVNLLAGAWIQFMVHDWFVHKRSTTETFDIPIPPGDDWSDPKMLVPKTEVDPSPAGSKRPPAYVNLNSHWWDASQIYGCDAKQEALLRSGVGGRLRLEPTGLLPVDPATGLQISGFTDNWWVGLAMLHTLFTQEHNYIVDHLAAQYPKLTDAQLFTRGKLINSALMAKIHTVEWTIAILPHPLVRIGLNANWSGLLGEDLQQVFEVLDDKELLGGIVGTTADHHAAPYSLTEEFVSIYRMHPLIPDDYTFRSLATGRELKTFTFPEIAGKRTPAVFEQLTMQDLFYSFGTSHPGAVKLHNYPRFLQNLTRDDGEHLDLAAVDILRDRERGVPRYNEFRRQLHKRPVKSFDELTDNPEWAKQIKQVYNNDLEAVDLMTGLFAEPFPEGFGFSETAFRLFILMASRRLKSDRFFTDDYRPEVYTEWGLEHIRKSSMIPVLRRHFPQLSPALSGVTNAFAPWTKVTPSDTPQGGGQK